MVISESDARQLLTKGSHILVVTNGRIEVAAPFSQKMLDLIMHQTEADGTRCITFTTKPPFAMVDPPSENVAVLVQLDGENYSKLFELPESATLDEVKIGTRVLCQTSQGRKKGTVTSKQIRITQSMKPVLATLTGAVFPIKPVVATIHTRYFAPYHD